MTADDLTKHCELIESETVAPRASAAPCEHCSIPSGKIPRSLDVGRGTGWPTLNEKRIPGNRNNIMDSNGLIPKRIV